MRFYSLSICNSVRPKFQVCEVFSPSELFIHERHLLWVVYAWFRIESPVIKSSELLLLESSYIVPYGQMFHQVGVRIDGNTSAIWIRTLRGLHTTTAPELHISFLHRLMDGPIQCPLLWRNLLANKVSLSLAVTPFL